MAVHKDHGFVRIKSFEQGNVPENVLELNKSKSSFTRLVETFKDSNRTNMVSLYSNDGSLQNYVSRLKAAGINLKENQIEFFFYSLF